MKRIAVVLAILHLSLTASLAQIDRTKAPPAGPAPKVSFPEFATETLKNGLKVFVVENHEQPLVTFNLTIKSGTEYDGDKPGKASFVCDLLTKGTANRTAAEFAREEDFIGVSVGASASTDQVSFSGGGLKKYTGKILDLMTDALYHPTFPEEELEKSRKQSLSALAYEKSDPGSLMEKLLKTVMFKDHPYGGYPTERSVKSITRDDLRAFYETYFIPNNSSLAIVGDVTAAEIMPVVDKYFGPWKKGSPVKRAFPAPASLHGITVHIVDRPGSVQSSVSVVMDGMMRSNPDYPQFGVLSAILGGGSSGRLYKNLREKHGFTYGAYSGLDARRMAGMFTASAEVRREATDSAVTEILAELGRLRKDPVTEEERDLNVHYLVGQYMMSLESADMTATRVQNIDLYGLPKDYYRNYIKTVEAFNAKRAAELAKKYLNLDQLAILVVGDAGGLKPALEAFGPVTVYDTDIRPVEMAPAGSVEESAEQVIAQYIEAIGGQEVLEAIRTRSMEGKVTIDAMGQQIKGNLIQIEKAPDKQYQKFSLPMGMQEIWVDGKTAVRSSGGTKEQLSGDELTRALEEAAFLDFLRFPELGFTVGVKGKRDIDGKPAIALEIRKKSGAVETRYFDTETHFLVKDEKWEGPPGQETSVATTYGDYREEGGMIIPHTIKQEPMGASITITIVSCAVNREIDDSTFTAK